MNPQQADNRERTGMLYKQLIELYDLLDSPAASGKAVAEYLRGIDPEINVTTYPLESPKGTTDMVQVIIPGKNGKSNGGTAPTMGLLGRLGGLGARPERIGFVSDGDGALVALACAAKLASMRVRGDVLEGDVVISTHICPCAPTSPHEPVPFMGSPTSTALINAEDAKHPMDAVLVCDTTKGNRIINTRGFAISPTVKQGVILRVSEDLLDIMQNATGRLPQVYAISMADITPYGNGLYHINSIMQPCTATDAPVVGVAITTETAVPGCGTGATRLPDLDEAGTFMLEVTKAFTEGKCSLFAQADYDNFVERYGTMSQLQTFGNLPAVDPLA